ncbi:hypothetical protein [Paracidovorax cattleyae]|nr:hypothetical protein [Paracidovorax cattleyae]
MMTTSERALSSGPGQAIARKKAGKPFLSAPRKKAGLAFGAGARAAAEK